MSHIFLGSAQLFRAEFHPPDLQTGPMSVRDPCLLRRLCSMGFFWLLQGSKKIHSNGGTIHQVDVFLNWIALLFSRWAW